MRVLAPCICPQTGNIKLLQPPSMVLNRAEGSQTGFGKQVSARSISDGDKSPTGSSISDLNQTKTILPPQACLCDIRLRYFCGISVYWSVVVRLLALHNIVIDDNVSIISGGMGATRNSTRAAVKVYGYGEKKKKKTVAVMVRRLYDRFATKKMYPVYLPVAPIAALSSLLLHDPPTSNTRKIAIPRLMVTIVVRIPRVRTLATQRSRLKPVGLSGTRVL